MILVSPILTSPGERSTETESSAQRSRIRGEAPILLPYSHEGVYPSLIRGVYPFFASEFYQMKAFFDSKRVLEKMGF